MRKPTRDRFPLAAKVVIAGSALLSMTYYGLWLWNAQYLPWWQANLALAVAAGVLTAALDTLKPLFWSVAKWHWQAKRKRPSIAPAAMALLLAIVSMWSIDGLLLRLRTDAANTPANIISQWERTAAAMRKAESELTTLGPSRPVAEITAAMGRVQIDITTLRRTNHCQPDQITLAESRSACQPLIELHAEQARANRKAQLEGDIATARVWLDTNKKPASPDPQLAAYAAVTGVTESTVALVVAFTVGLALELVSLFGPAMLVRREEHASPRSPITPASRLEPVVITAVEVQAPTAAPPPNQRQQKLLVKPVRPR